MISNQKQVLTGSTCLFLISCCLTGSTCLLLISCCLTGSTCLLLISCCLTASTCLLISCCLTGSTCLLLISCCKNVLLESIIKDYKGGRSIKTKSNISNNATRQKIRHLVFCFYINLTFAHDFEFVSTIIYISLFLVKQ